MAERTCHAHIDGPLWQMYVLHEDTSTEVLSAFKRKLQTLMQSRNIACVASLEFYPLDISTFRNRKPKVWLTALTLYCVQNKCMKPYKNNHNYIQFIKQLTR